MSKKIVKRKKIKIRNFLRFLLFLIIIGFSIYLLLQVRLSNIIIKNTSYLNDDYIIDIASIKDYPKFFFINSKKIEKDLKKSDYIQNAKVKRRFPFSIVIEVFENRPLFYDNSSLKYVFDDKKSVVLDDINFNFKLPRLNNYVPDTKYDKFIYEMSKLDKNILGKISDIEYQPNEYDKDRFLIYMDDGNMVYLTLTKFKMINHYNEVLSQLEGHKGILYLDNGNHFEIRE